MFTSHATFHQTPIHCSWYKIMILPNFFKEVINDKPTNKTLTLKMAIVKRCSM
jgi:hypothetical protein